MIKTAVNYPAIIQSLELVNDRCWLENCLENIEDRLEPTYLNRLNKWCDYFNSRFIRSMCIYTETIQAIMEASLTNQLFRTQTTLEFETSLKFYDFLLNANYFIKGIDKESGLYLLNISLVVGKYPGMLLRSARNSIYILKNGVTLEKLRELFQLLFIKFENPRILTNHLPKLSIEEIELIMHVNLGNNISKFEKLPLPLSKKEAFILLNKLPNNLKLRDFVLERTIICAKLIASNSEEKHLIEFLNCSRTYRYRLNQFYNDISFWKDAYSIICLSDLEQNRLTILEYIDYFEYKKYTENISYSLKGRTINSVYKAIHNWHEEAIYQNKLELLNLSWNGTQTPELKVKFRNHNYSIKEITEGRELFMESQKLQHCAFSYIENCYQGYTSIWSLKKEINTIMYHYITIEVSYGEIVQIVGKKNRKVNSVEFKLIEQWAENKQFIIPHYICPENYYK